MFRTHSTHWSQKLKVHQYFPSHLLQNSDQNFQTRNMRLSFSPLFLVLPLVARDSCEGKLQKGLPAQRPPYKKPPSKRTPAKKPTLGKRPPNIFLFYFLSLYFHEVFLLQLVSIPKVYQIIVIIVLLTSTATSLLGDLYYHYIEMDVGGWIEHNYRRDNRVPFIPPTCPPKNHIVQGVGGSPYKNLKPYDKPFWDFTNGGENNKKKRINLPKLVAYLSLLRWSHALRSDQKLLTMKNTVEKSWR